MRQAIGRQRFVRGIPYGLLLGVLGWVGCAPETQAPDAMEPLSRRAELIRLSMDLRGIHPNEQELVAYDNALDADATYAAYADEWIDEPAFIGRVKEIFNERFLVRTGDVYFDTNEIPALNGIDDVLMADNIANEVLSLLEYTVANDLPYSYMVTADHTMANSELAAYWGIDYPRDGGGNWVPAQYLDGRPHAGVLTMSTTWQRYPSMGGNANRHRANAISKMFLCDDYLSRPIVLNRAAVDQLTIDPENAINQNVGCQGCHASLDPMAANFFGFFNYDPEDGIQSTAYRPENEEEWRYYSGKEPAFYGRPTGNIPEFAQALADDSRFVDCAVQTVWEGLTQRDFIDDDWPEVQKHAELFSATDMNVKELFRSIVNSEEYRAVAARDPELAERFVGAKIASPEQLSSMFKDLTGYGWYFGGRDGLKNQSLGLPVLAGGIDSRFVTTRSYSPTVGLVFIQERLAQAAASYVAAHDLDPARTEEAKLLLYVTVQDTPESNPDAFDQQIRHLYLAITGTALPEDSTLPQQQMDLWKYLYSVEASPTSAWAGVLSTVLRDPQVIFY
ncbi:MAG: DUF1592 domain-containing protein [Myxococcota bacterium]